jgi:hypothetical protein
MRRHLSYANVVATLALVFAMSGTGLAAKHYLINSTKQINPKVLKALRGNKGPAGLEGREGPAGKGAEGPAGKLGATGKEGPTGREGPTGATGAIGTTGAGGVTGATGATGASGMTGNAGSTGAKGEIGATGASGAAGATGTKGSSGPTGPAGGATGPTGSPGSTYSTFTSVSGVEVTTEHQTVVSMPINPPFAGHLLIQASGRAEAFSPPSGVGCQPFAPSGAGAEDRALLSATLPVMGLAVIGATLVTSGERTVGVECNQEYPGRSTRVEMTIVALVTG